MFYFEPLSHLVSERCRGPQALPKPWLLCLLPCPLKAIGHERGLRWLLEQQRISVAQACPEMGSQVMPRLMGKMRIWTSGFRIWILQTNLCEPWSCGWLRILYGRSKTPELPLKSLKLRISRIHSDSHPKKKTSPGDIWETKTPQPGAGCIARSSEIRSGRIQAATAKVQRGNSNSSAKVRDPESDRENPDHSLRWVHEIHES